MTREQGFGAEVKRRIMLGTFALSAGTTTTYYNKALKVRRLIRNDFDAAFGGGRAAVADLADPGVQLGERAADPLAMYLSDIYTIPPTSPASRPSRSPAACHEVGLPVGLQLLAPAFAEDRLYRVAAAAEAALTGRWGRPLLAEAKGL